MIYPIAQNPISPKKRVKINADILSAIDREDMELSKDNVYNLYTGIGELHGLKRSDYKNFNEYSTAKKEVEVGQFFTPHHLCKRIIEMIDSTPTDRVLDIGCGMGNFFNHLPNLHNAYGFDIDANAVKVAKYLYADAHIDVMDMSCFRPSDRFDIVVGNPPFNMTIDYTLSQYYFCEKAYEALLPAGLLMLIVPCSFMQSDFWNRRQVNGMETIFSFIGQVLLPSDAFEPVGVDNFGTKIMAFLRDSEQIESKPYIHTEFIT